MKLALLTAAIQGDNAGDAFIEDAVRRIVAADEYYRFPLLRPLTDAQIESVNQVDAALICGTNLYQSKFACNLTVPVIRRIRPPIIPIGVGSSAPIGRVPRMRNDSVLAVRALHERCRLSSVRDPASLRFLQSIGVGNATLTGCPVLFHSLACPDFEPSGAGYTLTPRARLLHLKGDHDARQLETLRLLSRRYRPKLVLQSPYDLPIAKQLAAEYGLEIVYNEACAAEPYLTPARQQFATAGFRLHFGMLSLSYGKPAYFVAHDSRVAEFCDMMGLPCFDFRDYSDSNLCLNIDVRSFDSAGFRRRWGELAAEMNGFLAANGLKSRLQSEPLAASPTSSGVGCAPSLSLSQPLRPKRKPRILLLVDTPHWAFDHSARQIAKELRDCFRFDIRYVRHNPRIRASAYDLLYIFFWGEEIYKDWGFPPERIIKELSSHRWEDDPDYGPCTPQEFVQRYLRDTGSVVCTSARLKAAVDAIHPHTYLTPNGIDPDLFRPLRRRTGPIVFGWAGNSRSPLKGLHDILLPASEGRFELRIARGNLSHRRMNTFYNSIDVFAVASEHEGEPLTLIEAMAAGCFPVCCDVGIVAELIRQGENGLIVKHRTPRAFREAFTWCEDHPDHVRRAGLENALWTRRERKWAATAPHFKRAFLETLERARRPKFRNDDVSPDTNLGLFKKFCRAFHKFGLTQLHGVTLRGRTSTIYRFDDEPAEYENTPNISRLPNETIRALSESLRLEARTDLVDFLNGTADEIALHGLYHTDYSAMSADQQRQEIAEGLTILQRLFPQKQVRYFIAPFNRPGAQTAAICREFGLYLLAAEGVHLEAELPQLEVQPAVWHRYHHHRFYPESAFDYYHLSLEALDAALARNFPLPQSEAPRDMGLARKPGPVSWITGIRKLLRRAA